MSFASPLGLVALLVVPATLAFAVAIRGRRSRSAVGFSNLEVLASVVDRQRCWRPWVPVALLLLALTLATGALARPRMRLSTQVDNATVVMLVDVSRSMRAEDVEPTRLDAATAAIRSFLDRLPERFKVGLVEFSSEPTVLVRPTHNRDSLRESIAYLQADAGTAIGDGLATATRLVRQSLARDAAQEGGKVPGAIVLLSDGTQSRGRLEPLAGAKRARNAGIRVDTIALGTPDGFVRVLPGAFILPAPPDPPLMRAIAGATGGRTFAVDTSAELGEVFDGLGSSIGRQTETREITSWFAFAAAVLLLAALAAGRLLTGALA
jgi:Ca-activated chloride channel homolog